jgi:lysine-N-methylase
VSEKRERTERRLAQIHLPPGARFTCHQCGDCCRSFPVSLSDEETKAYAERDWSQVLPGHAGPVFFESSTGPGRSARFLHRQVDGSCIFLDSERNLCRIHDKLGEAAKPLACRLFPFTVVPGDLEDPRPRVGCHFACKGLAAGDGKPVAGERRALESLVQELGRVHPLEPSSERLDWEPGRSYERTELEVVAALLTAELEDAGRPFPERILTVAKFIDLFSKSAFKQVKDEKRRDFVEILAQGVREQVKKGLLKARETPPDWNERLLFRQILGMSVRRDPAGLLTAGTLRRTARRVSSLLSGIAFSAGGGSFVPTGRERRVRVSDVRRLAPEADPASPEADGALTRYFVAHVASRRVLDPAFKVRDVLAGYGLLLRQYPAILLYARAACLAREGAALDSSDYASALRTADWTFGHVSWTAGLVGRSRRLLLGDLEAPFRHLNWCALKPRRK